MKFGGTSVGTGQNIRHVAGLVTDYAKNEKQSSGCCFRTCRCHQQPNRSRRPSQKSDGKTSKPSRKPTEKHQDAIIAPPSKKTPYRKKSPQSPKAIIAELGKVLTGICYVGELTPKSKDYVLSFGERLSAPIVWGAIKDHKLETQCFTGKEAGIVTDSDFGDARPLMNFTIHLIRERLGPLLEKDIVPVVTGFIAANQDGITTTVGRGGSDYTATILGVSLKADEVWIWTDVDGIMTTDPKIVPAAKMLPELSYQEAAEMAIFGAKAMHPRALGPVIKEKIPVRIRSTLHPENPGTLITQKHSKATDAVKAVAIIKDVAMVNVYGTAMVGEPGSYAKVFDVLGKNNINVMMISAAVSEANIS